MFSESKHHPSQLERGTTVEPSDTGSRKQIIEKSSSTNLKGNITEASYQNYPQEIAEDSEDDFNYDDPIITELLDKDWDKELEMHKKSPNDKAAHFDINSTIIGAEGGKKDTRGALQFSQALKQPALTPAWSVEECESDILAIQQDTSRPLLKGDTSANRTSGIQDTTTTGEEEEETTPIYNRFQTLQNLEEEGTPPLEPQTLLSTEAATQAFEAQDDKSSGQRLSEFGRRD
ncbi:hypothetical protein Salat_0847000 [Sesamum alatum]|uniref:Uncharacterized protein n=1 Tax=Sesamum alatum TaxID=300844 RepID=A0AAE1YIQ6_9LAMI|nr:hypothetical protein Salat_0847000 [Sesamum alatum]